MRDCIESRKLKHIQYNGKKCSLEGSFGALLSNLADNSKYNEQQS